jgi:geranylgeranyl pyrophosphate synthase
VSGEIRSALHPFALKFPMGKQIRSEIVYLMGEDIGLDKEILREMAVVVEGIHNASLFIDDIIDSEELRRGAPPLFYKHGEKKAIAYSFLLLSRLLQKGEKHFPLLSPFIVKTFEKMSLGELTRAEQKNYLAICYRKTGALFVLSALLPVLHAELSSCRVKKIYSFFRNFGILYQIQDDLLDGDVSYNENREMDHFDRIYRQLQKAEKIPVFQKSEIGILLNERVNEWLSPALVLKKSKSSKKIAI